ncbi:MAG: AsmA family protein [Desulfobacteraceae bacterium]|nr:AsmA family protein [Desulfobacteraceae bacterium]
MKKVLKVVAILFGVALVVLAGLALFVHFYLTNDRVKALLLPRLQETLGRQVTMEKLDVGLFRGITLQDFAVKEQNGATDFFRAKAFVLRYQLLPLFHGRLIVSKAILTEPFIRIERNRQGQFNFATLAFLHQKDQKPSATEGMVALPLALTINQVAIEKARFQVRDQLGKLPALDGTGNVHIAVHTASGTLVYHGLYDFSADAAYRELKPHLTGRGDFDPQKLSYTVDTTLDRQTAHLEGTAENWREIPRVRLDLSAKQLDLDRLLALMGGGAQAAAPPAAKSRKKQPAPAIPEKTGAALPAAGRPKSEAAGKAGPPAPPSPPGLTAAGTIRVDRVLYQKIELQQLAAAYDLKDSILRISGLSARTAGGTISGGSRIDLTRPEPAYTAAMKMSGLQAGELAALLSERYGQWLTGRLTSSTELAGRGTTWPQIREALALKSDFTVADGQLREFPVTAAAAEILNLPELRAPSFRSLTGTVRVAAGQALLDSVMTAKDLEAKVAGTIGLDGRLNLPVALRLTGELARKIQARTSLARYLTDSGNGVVLNFRLTGDVSRPRPVLDLGAARQKLQQELEQKAGKELERFLRKNRPQQQSPDQQGAPPPAPSVPDLLKGLLGR